MGTWTIGGIGSNSTGSFTIPANTGSVSVTYNVTYDDGDGGGGSTSITVPACPEPELTTNSISLYPSMVENVRISIDVNSTYPVASSVTCSGQYTYSYKDSVTNSTLTKTSPWSITIPANEQHAQATFDGPNAVSIINCCCSSISPNSDTKYEYTTSSPCD